MIAVPLGHRMELVVEPLDLPGIELVLAAIKLARIGGAPEGSAVATRHDDCRSSCSRVVRNDLAGIENEPDAGSGDDCLAAGDVDDVCLHMC